jgi:hypothetical protein
MRGTDGDALASGGAPAAEHGGAGIGLHARPEAVRFRAVAAVGLKCSFGHRDPLLFPKENLQFSCNIEYIADEFQNPPEEGCFTMWQGSAAVRRMLKRAARRRSGKRSISGALQ